MRGVVVPDSEWREVQVPDMCRGSGGTTVRLEEVRVPGRGYGEVQGDSGEEVLVREGWPEGEGGYSTAWTVVEDRIVG